MRPGEDVDGTMPFWALPGLPKPEDAPDDQQWVLERLEEGAEYDDIVSKFRTQGTKPFGEGKGMVVRIDRVQNTALWRRYAGRRHAGRRREISKVTGGMREWVSVGRVHVQWCGGGRPP